MEGSATPTEARTWQASGLYPVQRYWQSLRRGGALPARTDLDPVALRPWLSRAGIVEHTREGRLRLRLGGSGLSRLMGVEARGMPLRAIFAVGTRPRLQDLAEAVFREPSVLVLRAVAAPAAPDTRPIHVDMVMLPLTDSAGGVTRALLCVDHDPRANIAAPCRFHIRYAQLQRLSVGRCAPRSVSVSRAGGPALRVIPGGRDGATA